MKLTQLDKYRPNLHFAPEKNWMNDPNGMVYFKGEYHLFFQHNPAASVWGPMHWGHAVSKDMIKWEQLDIALYPDELGTIFSGSAVIDWNNTTGFFPDEPGMVAIFTHHLDNEGSSPTTQTQSLAYSHDKGRTWIKYKGNPVLKHDIKSDFRDPKVFWHNLDEKWLMVLATGQTVSFYSSPNLIDWKFESEFGEGVGSHNGVWECPDLFELPVEHTHESKWVLLVSIGDNIKLDQGSCTQYFVGSFDGTTFIAEHNDIKWLDFGKDNYAGVSFSDIPDKDGRRIYLGWMSNWRYANEIPTDGWRSQMTLPRKLSLSKEIEYRIIQSPVKELNGYFKTKETLSNVQVTSEEIRSFTVDGAYAKIDLKIENVDAKMYGITLYHTNEQYTEITIDKHTNKLTFDRSNAGKVDFSKNFSSLQTVQLTDTDQIQLQLVVDASSIELFINDGEYALTSLVYPDRAATKISLFTSSGEIVVPAGRILTPNN